LPKNNIKPTDPLKKEQKTPPLREEKALALPGGGEKELRKKTPAGTEGGAGHLEYYRFLQKKKKKKKKKKKRKRKKKKKKKKKEKKKEGEKKKKKQNKRPRGGHHRQEVVRSEKTPLTRRAGSRNTQKKKGPGGNGRMPQNLTKWGQKEFREKKLPVKEVSPEETLSVPKNELRNLSRNFRDPK